MNGEELRAITAAGPHVVMADRESMLNLLDNLAEAEKEVTSLAKQRRLLVIFILLYAPVVLTTFYLLLGPLC